MKHLTNEQLVTTFRALADYYEAHPTVPAPLDMNWGWMRVYLNDTDKTKDILRVAGSFDKVYEGTEFIARIPVGHITLDLITDRGNVCVKRVVGKKAIPAQVVPAQFVPEKVIEAHEEDIVEWDCGEPIMAVVDQHDGTTITGLVDTVDAVTAGAGADMVPLTDDDIPF